MTDSRSGEQLSPVVPKKGEKRMKGNTLVKLMAVADGYVMARHPGALPFLMSLKEWLDLEEAS